MLFLSNFIGIMHPLKFMVALLLAETAHCCFTRSFREHVEYTQTIFCSRSNHNGVPLPVRRGKALICNFLQILVRGKRSASSSVMSEKSLVFDITVLPEQFYLLFAQDNVRVTMQYKEDNGIVYGTVKDVEQDEDHAPGRRKRNIVDENGGYEVEVIFPDGCNNKEGCEFVGQFSANSNSPKLRLRRSVELNRTTPAEPSHGHQNHNISKSTTTTSKKPKAIRKKSDVASQTRATNATSASGISNSTTKGKLRKLGGEQAALGTSYGTRYDMENRSSSDTLSPKTSNRMSKLASIADFKNLNVLRKAVFSNWSEGKSYAIMGGVAASSAAVLGSLYKMNLHRCCQPRPSKLILEAANIGGSTKMPAT